MKRYFFDDLEKWLKKKDRQPLIIRGARQVGKSTSVSLFAKEFKLDLIEVNLEKKKIKAVEQEDIDLKNVLKEIELYTKKRVGPKSLIFFDEIQESPKLLSLLRYFYEEMPEIKIIAAGSLLELALHDGKISFPVGRVEFLHIGPMTFFEFLEALDEHILLEEIKKEKFSTAVVAKSQNLFIEYLQVGGMPKSILTYIETKSLLEVRDVQDQILQTYKNDFPKYAKRISLDRIDKVFNSTFFHLGKKTIFQNIDREAKARDTRKILELFFDAKIFLPVYHAECSGLPLISSMDSSLYKLYFLDVGLLNSKLQLEDLSSFANVSSASRGILLEQFAAQHLNIFNSYRQEPSLLYWLRDKASNKAEVDFVKQMKNQIVPIEVKSSFNAKAKSLNVFMQEKHVTKAVKLNLEIYKKDIINKDISTKGSDKNLDIEIIYYPIWAIENLSKS